MRISKQEVLDILEKYPSARNSDISLTTIIWQVYFPNKMFRDKYDNVCVRLKDLYDLPREDNIKRYRADIQNVDEKFPPTTLEIAKKRKMSEERWRRILGYEPPFVE